jgi:hypothetical protein
VQLSSRRVARPILPEPHGLRTLSLMLFAHTGHVLTTIAYFVPVVGFLAWLIVTQIKERRRGTRGES